MLGLTACGEQEAVTPLMTEAEAEAFGAQVVDTVSQYVAMQIKDQIDDPITVSAMDSWEAAADDMGDFVEIISTESSLDDEDGVIDVRVKGSLREAIVEIVIDKKVVTSI